LFYSKSVTADNFTGDEIDVADAVAIQINGLPISLGGTFDTGTLAGANAYVAAVQVALAAAGYVYSVSGGWDGVGLTISIITTAAVTSVVVVSATGADVALSVSTKTFTNIYDASTASTGATLTDLAWTLAGPVTFNGAPTESIIGTPDVFGLYGNFFAVEYTGATQLIITDSVACEDTANKTI
jgi:hypothetical protein